MGELVHEARTWLRAAVVTGLVPESRPLVSPYAPGPGEPVDLELLLLAGGAVTLVQEFGRLGRADERIMVYEAHAHDAMRRVFGLGVDEDDPIAALRDLRGPRNPATAPPERFGDA